MKTVPDQAAEAMSRAQAQAMKGDIAGAAEICRRLLSQFPSYFPALYMLGGIESHQKRFAEAAQILERAVKANPRVAEAWTVYGDTLLELKRNQDAVAALTNALRLAPNAPNALIYRGLAYAELGKDDAALKDFTRAAELDPRSVHARHNRANVLIRLKRYKDARADVDAVLRLEPHQTLALHNHAFLLIKEGDFAEALRVSDFLVTRDPNNASTWTVRGQVLLELKRPEEDLRAFEKATQLNPKDSEAHLGCGNILMDAGRAVEALSACDTALKHLPKDAPILLLRANALFHVRRDEDSLQAYADSIAADPDYAEAYYHRGSTLLALGRFKEGLKDFEHRWDVADCNFDRSAINGPVWQGEDLRAKTIAVYSEQGLGDAIQFARFLPELIARGAKLTFLCHPNLVRLFAPFAREMEVIASVDKKRRFDFQSALMSLPLYLGLDAPPAQAPYLFAEEALAATWRDRIGRDGFKIGIAWQGNPKGAIDKGRSAPLKEFAPLAALPGVRLISLQRIHGLDQLETLPPGMAVETLGSFDEGGQAFIDTAAIMQNLDLVAVTDSAIAHLAGALGRPTFLALKDFPDWRWMLDRTDTPWYPSLTLFRQASPGDWGSVFAAMRDAVRGRLEGTS